MTGLGVGGEFKPVVSLNFVCQWVFIFFVIGWDFVIGSWSDDAQNFSPSFHDSS